MSVNLDLSFDVENGLTFSETGAAVFSGVQDPSTGAGIPAPVGSLFLRTNGQIYSKTGVIDSSWNFVLRNGDVNITAAQPPAGLVVTGSPINNTGTLTFSLANDLAALESLTGTGIAVRTSADTWANRSIIAGSSKISVVNGSGAVDNPVIDVVESNLVLNNISGTLSTDKGGTGLTAIGSSNRVLGVNGAGTALEYKAIVSGTGITITNTTGQISISASSTATSSMRSYSADIASRAFTTVIKANNTEPTVSEGSEIARITVTPNSTLSKFNGAVSVWVDSANYSKIVTLAVFRGSVLVGVASTFVVYASSPQALSITFADSPNTASPVTYTVRAGRSDAGTFYINAGGGYAFGAGPNIKTAFILNEIL